MAHYISARIAYWQEKEPRGKINKVPVILVFELKVKTTWIY